MTRKKLCEMCSEYSTEYKCELQEDCRLQAILTENIRLKADNRELKKKIKELETKRSWELSPDRMGK